MGFYQSKITIDPADKLFSTFVRNRDGWKCKLKFKCTGVIDFSENKGAFSTCHYHGRSKRTVRFDPDNADGGCTPCHQYYDEKMKKEDREAWKKNQLGEERFRNLNIRANQTQRIDKKMELLYVKELVKLNNYNK